MKRCNENMVNSIMLNQTRSFATILRVFSYTCSHYSDDADNSHYLECEDEFQEPIHPENVLPLLAGMFRSPVNIFCLNEYPFKCYYIREGVTSPRLPVMAVTYSGSNWSLLLTALWEALYRLIWNQTEREPDDGRFLISNTAIGRSTVGDFPRHIGLLGSFLPRSICYTSSKLQRGQMHDCF